MQRSFSDSGHSAADHRSAQRSVLIALSGGIDSTAAALMLLEQGYSLIGCTFVTRYTSPASVEAAQALAARLGIEHHVVDYSETFESAVIDYFIKEYQSGRTPNPCVLCNRLIKFGALVKEADQYGCGYIATGHYARIGCKGVEGRGKECFVKRAADLSKDQSYFLWQVDPDILPRVLFPLGEYTKVEVREYLARKGFEVLSKQGESQDICFISGDYRSFLRERLREEYKEYMSFTIGQRKGLGVALGYPAFVTRIDVEANKPVLGHHDDLYMSEVQLRDVIFRGDPNRSVEAKIRYRTPAASATLHSQHSTLNFNDQIWAPTPGQSCVMYQDDLVVGGGIIC